MVGRVGVGWGVDKVDGGKLKKHHRDLNVKGASGNLAESRRDQEEGGELDSHEEVRRFCGSRRDQEEGCGAGPTS